MLLKEIVHILGGKVLTETFHGEVEIASGGAADLMSDVLAFTKEKNSLLLSGLTNQQVLRTAEMSNIGAIVFVRGKIPPPPTIELAENLSIPLISCRHSMYQACGLLFKAGLPDNGVASILCQ
jgi:hypothetical protein